MTNNPYSTEDLKFFKSLIQEKLDQTQTTAQSIKGRLDGLEDQAASNGGQSSGEDSKNQEQRNNLTRLYEREIEQIKALELALGRIANKTYGIDPNTGDRIRKARLMAMLTATNTLETP